MSNYMKKFVLVCKIISANIVHGYLNYTQFVQDVESSVAIRYGDDVTLPAEYVEGLVRNRDIAFPVVQEQVAHGALKYLWVHHQFDLNKREAR